MPGEQEEEEQFDPSYDLSAVAAGKNTHQKSLLGQLLDSPPLRRKRKEGGAEDVSLSLSLSLSLSDVEEKKRKK